MKLQSSRSVHAEVFNKFKKPDGKFSETLIGNVRGMLSLYEASHMMVHGEDILEEALAFTTVRLKSVSANEHIPLFLVNLVRRGLKHPIRKELLRLEAWHYILIYQSDPSHNQVLLSLAKSDFHSLQKLHQKEVCEIVR